MYFFLHRIFPNWSTNHFAIFLIEDMDHTLWIQENGGHYLSDRKDSLRLVRIRFAAWSPLFRLFFGPWGISDGNEMTQELLHITLRWLCLSCEVVSRFRLSGVSKRGTHRRGYFLMPNISCRIWSRRSIWILTVSANSDNFNRRSTNTKSRTFHMLSGLVFVASLKKPTCDYVKNP